jgi:predicted XRE-type DNA-binding protein
MDRQHGQRVPAKTKRRGRPKGAAGTKSGPRKRRYSTRGGSGGEDAAPQPRAKKALIPKAELADEIATIIRYRHLNQTEAAKIVGDAPSQMSLLLAGKIEGFSIERLLRMLLRLGTDIELVFRPAGNNRSAKFRISYARG